mmetsp:Transcript_5554/g.12078  ORF Transcript_5554/g.12078 Transcript_5554/m.12078 type:complete len:380 (-) Transcript_5554:157-1296(-)
MSIQGTKLRARSTSDAPLKKPTAPSVGAPSKMSGGATNKKTDEDGYDVVPANNRPWYRAGGLWVTFGGMAMNIFGSIIYLSMQLPEERMKQFWMFTLLCVACTLPTCRMVYTILIVPATMCSAVLVFQFGNWPTLMAISVAMAIWKVNVCMSVCYHRYAAHRAFDCGPLTQLFVCTLGCVCNQGGPLWWASMHRCHHKHCDVPRDPHSALVDGTEQAFGFFHGHEMPDEEFVPRYLEKPHIRWLDTWSFAVVSAELLLAKHFFGVPGLFCAHTSSWICQELCCWFNVANHPRTQKETGKACKAIDASEGRFSVEEWYVPFLILDAISPFFGKFVMEGEHKHHHENAMLAKRAKYDIAYWGFVKPLEMMGLVWDVQTGEF